MNTNEPVAWLVQYRDRHEFRWNKPEHLYEALACEPLYRHPVKELTDKQILCLWDWWSGEILATDILDFADTYKRALLGETGLVEWHEKYVERMNNEDPAWKAREQYECNGFCGEYECKQNKSKCKRKATQE